MSSVRVAPAGGGDGPGPGLGLLLPERTRQQELDEAEIEAEAEGRAVHATAAAESESGAANQHSNGQAAAALTGEEYISQTVAQLNLDWVSKYALGGGGGGGAAASSPGRAPPPPADSAHPSIRVHGVHGLDPRTDSRDAIEAKLEAIDQARKREKKAKERDALAAAAPSPSGSASAAPCPSEPEAPDEQILRILALRKLQLLQQHLRCDNQPVLVLAPTQTRGGVYLGSVGASHHLPHLLSAGITHVLSVGRNLAQPFPQHLEYLYVPMLDSSTTRITRDVYEACWAFIERGRRGASHDQVLHDADADADADSHHDQDGHAPDSNDAAVAAVDEAAVPKVRGGLEYHTHFPNQPAALSPHLRAHARSSVQGVEGVCAALAVTELHEGRVHQHSAHRSHLAHSHSHSHSHAHVHGHSHPHSHSASHVHSSPSSTDPPRSPRRGNVLVHCFAGKSRSTTILLSYLMHSQRWSLDHAFKHVKQCRPTINPNPGFLAQLRELDEALRQQRDEIARAQSHMTDPTSPTTDTDSATTATGNGNATTAD